MASASYPSILGSSIQTAEIDALAVTTAEIAAKAVTAAKLADGTADKAMGFDSLGVYAEIPQRTVEILDNHVAAGAEATYTFTPASALLFATYSEIWVVIEGAATAALALQMQLNGDTAANYSENGYRINAAPAQVILQNLGQTQLTLLTATVLAGAYDFSGISKITRNPLNNRYTQHSEFSCQLALEHEKYYGRHVAAAQAISSITVKTSISTWITGTRITTYGVRRA